jgi:hypothetical protein
MENYNDLCLKFINNPKIHPVNYQPINNDDFQFYKSMCNYYGYEIPEKTEKSLLRPDSLRQRTITSPNKILQPNEFTDFRTRPSDRRLLPIPKSYEIEQSVRLSGNKLLPIPEDYEEEDVSLRSRSNIRSSMTPNRRFNSSIDESNLFDADLKRLAMEVHRDENVKDLVFDNLNAILEKNGTYDYKSKKYILSKDGIEEFIFDLLIDNEIALVKAIIRYYDLEYIDILDLVFDNADYATNENLLLNYFIGAPSDTDWSYLIDILDTVYGTWLIEDKLNLLILLASIALSTNNGFLVGIINQVNQDWRDGIQDEIDEMEDYDEKDKIIDIVDKLDTMFLDM